MILLAATRTVPRAASTGPEVARTSVCAEADMPWAWEASHAQRRLARARAAERPLTIVLSGTQAHLDSSGANDSDGSPEGKLPCPLPPLHLPTPCSHRPPRPPPRSPDSSPRARASCCGSRARQADCRCRWRHYRAIGGGWDSSLPSLSCRISRCSATLRRKTATACPET